MDINTNSKGETYDDRQTPKNELQKRYQSKYYFACSIIMLSVLCNCNNNNNTTFSRGVTNERVQKTK